MDSQQMELGVETNPPEPKAVGTWKVGERKPREEALGMVAMITQTLQELGISPDDVYPGGSIRRGKSTVGDIDIAICDDRVNKGFYQKLEALLKEKGHVVLPHRVQGDSYTSVVVDDFLLELKKTSKRTLPFMLLHITGSGEFNKGLRAWVKSRGMKLSQDGLRTENDVWIETGPTEEAIFAKLGIPFVPPPARDKFNPPAAQSRASNDGIPAELLAKIPPEVVQKAKSFTLPPRDEKGVPIPRDFLWNKKARQGHYRMGGRFNIPDELKLDRYQ